MDCEVMPASLRVPDGEKRLSGQSASRTLLNWWPIWKTDSGFISIVRTCSDPGLPCGRAWQDREQIGFADLPQLAPPETFSGSVRNRKSVQSGNIKCRQRETQLRNLVNDAEQSPRRKYGAK